MIEYICIGGVNDTPEVAHQLGALLEGKNMWVNLIPYNPTDAGDRFGFKSPKDEDLVIFSRIIQEYDDAYGTTHFRFRSTFWRLRPRVFRLFG